MGTCYVDKRKIIEVDRKVINEKDLPKDDDNIDKNKNEYNIYIVKE